MQFIWLLNLPQDLLSICGNVPMLKAQTVIRQPYPDQPNIPNSFDFTQFTEIISEKQVMALFALLSEKEIIRTYNLLGPNNYKLLLYLQNMRKLSALHLDLNPNDTFIKADLRAKILNITIPREKPQVQPIFDVLNSMNNLQSLTIDGGHISKLSMHLLYRLPLFELHLNDTTFGPQVAGELHAMILKCVYLRKLALICLTQDPKSDPLQYLIYTFSFSMKAATPKLEEYQFTLTRDILDLHSLTCLNELKNLTIYFSQESNILNLDNLTGVLPLLSKVKIRLVQFLFKQQIKQARPHLMDLSVYIEGYRKTGAHVTVEPLLA